jgi:hypothetical protein
VKTSAAWYREMAAIGAAKKISGGENGGGIANQEMAAKIRRRKSAAENMASRSNISEISGVIIIWRSVSRRNSWRHGKRKA